MIDRIEELEFLRRFAYSEPSLPLILHGPKSIGKTTLLKAFVAEYPGNVVYIDFRASGGYGLFSQKPSFWDRFRRFFDRMLGRKQSFGSFEVTNPFEPEEAIAEMADFIDVNDITLVVLDELQEARFLASKYAPMIMQTFVGLAKNLKLCNVILATSRPLRLLEVLKHGGIERDFIFYTLKELPEDAVVRWASLHGIAEKTAKKLYSLVGGKPVYVAMALTASDPVEAAERMLEKAAAEVRELTEPGGAALKKLLEGRLRAKEKAAKRLIETGIAYPTDDFIFLRPESTLVKNALKIVLGGKRVKKKRTKA